MSNQMKWNGAKVKASFEEKRVRALTLSGITVEGKAVRLVPVDKGVLKNSITYVVYGKSKFFESGKTTEYKESNLRLGETITPNDRDWET